MLCHAFVPGVQAATYELRSTRTAVRNNKYVAFNCGAIIANKCFLVNPFTGVDHMLRRDRKWKILPPFSAFLSPVWREKMWGGVRILPAKEIRTQRRQSKMRLRIKCMRNLLEDI